MMYSRPSSVWQRWHLDVSTEGQLNADVTGGWAGGAGSSCGGDDDGDGDGGGGGGLGWGEVGFLSVRFQFPTV